MALPRASAAVAARLLRGRTAAAAAAPALTTSLLARSFTSGTPAAAAAEAAAAARGAGAAERNAAKASSSGKWLPVALAGVGGTVGAAALLAGAVAAAETATAPAHPVLGAVTLYQYDVCPFCNKVRAFFDLHKIPYTIVEVNPLFKGEISWSEYKKVPIVTCGDEQLNDSSAIMTELYGRLHPKKKGMFGGGKPSPAEEEEAKWLAWVDSRLVHVLTPNIYRTTGEALQAFDYITERGNFNFFEREAARYVGAVMMYGISKFVLKKKHGIEEERPALYECVDEFIAAVGKRDFLGGKAPNLADTAVFGVLRAVKTMDTWQDVMDNTACAPWYERMEKQCA